MTVRNFHTDLAFAERARHLLVEQVYPRMTNGHFVSLTGPSSGSLWLQRNAHIDAILQLRDGQSVTVEEKIVRGKYTAFAIETISNVERGKEGWIHTCTADWLLYGFTPPGALEFYFIPFPAFRAWFLPVASKYRTSDTPNRATGGGVYHTRCAIVPVADVKAAVGFTQHILKEE